MVFTLGMSEILSFVAVLISAGWLLISLTFKQFEKRLDEKLETLDKAVSEIKRLEIELIRNDAKAAQTYSTKLDQEKALERIFNMLEHINNALASKISREEVHKIIGNSHK